MRQWLFTGCLLRVGVALLSGLVVRPAVAEDAPPVGVRTGTHAEFGRVVFDFTKRTNFTMERVGDRLIVHFDSPLPVSGSATPPRNVRAIEGGAGQAVIELAPGAQVRAMQVGSRIALDVLDPGPAATAAQTTSATAAQTTSATAAQTTSATAAQTTSATAAQTTSATATQSAQRPSTPRPARRTPPTGPSLPILPSLAAAPPGQQAASRPDESPIASPSLATPPQIATPAPRMPFHAIAPTAASDASSPSLPSSAAQPSPPAVTSPPAQPSPPAVTAPIEIAAARVSLPVGSPGAAIAIPVAATTGAAAFDRGGTAMIVFDEKRPIDLAALRGDPVFGAASLRELSDATLLTLPLAPGAALTLARTASGWLVAVGGAAPQALPIDPVVVGTSVTLPVNAPGRVVVVPDPETGDSLLVGTERQSGHSVAITRRTPEFVLLPTFLGVAVQPLSDRPVLRADARGFVLGIDAPGEPGLMVSAPTAETAALADAANLTRRFDFPDLPTDALIRRVQAALASAAGAEPRARLKPRVATAQAMIALGLDAEAESLLRLASTEDPHAAAMPEVAGLSAVAAMLAGRLADADGIEDPRLNGTDEVALWRAVRAAMREEGAPAAAAIFAATAPLILTYPHALRERLLPLAAETMAEGGQAKAASALVGAHKDDPTLVFARGILAEQQGEAPAALTVYDALAAGRDRLLRARAASRAIKLRLATGALTPAAAADADEKLLYAWRGDARERDLRVDLAALRATAGQWRQALAMLRESETVLPDDRALFHGHLTETFAALLQGDAADKLAPLEFVALAEENADLLPDGPAGEAMVARLADRLVALDLPRRAEQVFEKLMATTGSAAAKAVFGARLAALHLEDRDYAGALDALGKSASEGLSPPLTAQRTLLYARAAAANGDVAKAVAALADLDTPEADEARAAILEAAHDWPAAESALAAYVAKAVPATGPLTEAQQHTVLRLASAAAEAGDEARLDALRGQEGARMAAGSLGGMFRMLTEKPVRGVSDLPRAAKETAAAAELPAIIRSLAAAPRAN